MRRGDGDRDARKYKPSAPTPRADWPLPPFSPHSLCLENCKPIQ
jgi:hypothetical protein